MGTRAEDELRRQEHKRLLRDPALEAAHERAAERQRELRRTRLYYFGLAGGRRS